jgi:hypothetical protein
MKRLITMAAVLMVGCATRTVEIPALIIDPPPYVPSYTGNMTVADAAEVLKLTPPVRVVHAASFEDGGTVIISIQDSKDIGYAFRRSPWAREEPVHYFIDFPKKEHGPEKLEWDDPRLKALSVLALNWVDSLYSRNHQRRIFAGEYMWEKPYDNQKANASAVLWLFRREELERQQGGSPYSSPAAGSESGDLRRSEGEI